MKKLTIKVITMMVVIVCIISAIAVPASALNYNYSDWIYTSETNTTGKTIAMFSGIWSNDNVSNTYMSLYSYCEGGPVDSFNTSMTMYIRDTDTVGFPTIASAVYSTEDDGERTFERTLNVIGGNCPIYARGVSEQRCDNINDHEDSWAVIYIHDWDYSYGGWKEFEI